MPGLVRKLLRALGRDLTPYPPVKSGDRNLMEILRRQRVDLVFDVGANVGQYALQLRRAGYRGRIVSFEPVTAAHAALEQAAAADPLWTVAPRQALGAKDGAITMQVSNRSDMSSALPMRAETLDALPKSKVIGTEEATLAKFADQYGHYASGDDVSFLKIDTQGFERQVLDGAGEALASLAGVQLEMSLRPLYDGESGYRDLIDYLTARGFEPALILPGFFSKTLGRQMQIDAVFVRADSRA